MILTILALIGVYGFTALSAFFIGYDIEEFGDAEALFFFIVTPTGSMLLLWDVYENAVTTSIGLFVWLGFLTLGLITRPKTEVVL